MRIERPARGTAILLVIIVAVLLALMPNSGAAQPALGQVPDLAAGSLRPDDLPEDGFQLAQAGYLEPGQFGYAVTGEDDSRSTLRDALNTSWVQGYSSILVLSSDRAITDSDPIAQVSSIVIQLDSAVAAEVVAAELAADGASEVIGEISVSVEPDRISAMVVQDETLILHDYAFDSSFQTRQNDVDWTAGSVAALVETTLARIGDKSTAGLSGRTIGIVGANVYWSLPQALYPSIQHYRMLDGRVLPYVGEVRPPAADAIAPNADDLYFSTQVIDSGSASHLTTIRLASFPDSAAVDAFAETVDAASIDGPFGFGVEMTTAEVVDGTRVARGTLDFEGERYSGYRTVRVVGSDVQVIDWLVGGSALIDSADALWLANLQATCLIDSREPCSRVAVEDMEARATPGLATPESGASDAVLQSNEFGWAVRLPPDDGWEITDLEGEIAGSDYVEITSGRSIAQFESVLDRHGDPERCVIDQLDLLRELETSAVVELGSDDPDERPAGLEDDHGWAIYTVEPLADTRADQEYTIRFDCYTIVPGEASLVMTHIAPRDLWADESAKSDRLREGIALPFESDVHDALLWTEADGWVNHVSSHGFGRRDWTDRAA